MIQIDSKDGDIKIGRIEGELSSVDGVYHLKRRKIAV